MMNNRLTFTLIFFISLIQFNIIKPVSTMMQLFDNTKITLFSISYKDDNNDDDEAHEDGHALKIKILYNTIYDEKVKRKKLLEIKKYNEEIIANQQKLQEIKQEKLKLEQKEIELEQLIKQTKENNRRKEAELKEFF